MLSKLFHYEMPETTNNTDINLLMSVLKSELEKRNYVVHVTGNFAKGTLGIFFSLMLDNKKYFVKTHLSGPEYRTNLIKEIIILKHLYNDYLDIMRVDLEIKDEVYSFLLMDDLKPLESKPNIASLNELIEKYTVKLSTLDVTKDKIIYNQLSNKYKLSEMQKKAYEAIDYLKANEHISDKIYTTIKNCLLSGEKKYGLGTYKLCHGDLSNKNILSKNNQMIVVDWEDAFLGTEHYDFIYWLTFFDQREYYRKEVFEELNLDKEECKYFMLLVVSLKCYLSVINRTYVNNSLSFDQRFGEIIDIFCEEK